MALFEELALRQLLVVTGKGGVGKTIIAAALGSMLADLGRRVLLLEVDPRENLHQVFDVPPSGGEIVRLGAHLSLQNLQPRQVIEDMVRQHLHLDILARRVTSSAVFQHFIEGAPGLKEVAVLSQAERMVSRHGRSAPRFDVVVLDAPATGHGISMLQAPQLVSEVIERGPIGAQARQLAAFIDDRRRTDVVTVTLAEEMPAQEALELRDALEEQVGRTPELLVVNAMYPPFPDVAVNFSATDQFLLRLWRERRKVNEREIERLRASWKVPMIQISMLPADRGPRLLAGVRQQMMEQAGKAA